MQLGNLNSDEFDTIIELIVAIMFMSFGMVAIVLMLRNMNERVEIYDSPDKIEISAAMREVEDPFYFTPYQAYMFAWHMDEFSYESLSYVGCEDNTNINTGHTTLPNGQIQSNQRLDISGVNKNKDIYTITLSVIDENGHVRNQFLTWRNRNITGIDNTQKSVRKSINAFVDKSYDSSETKQRYFDYYKGNTVMYHLELTDAFLGKTNTYIYEKGEGGKKFKWVLTPR